MAINWKNGFTPVSELTLDNFSDFARDYAQYAYMLCYKASFDEKQAVSLSASALAAVACKESGKESSSSLMPEEAIKRVLLDILTKQQLVRLNNDDIKTDKTATDEQLDSIVNKAVSIANTEMPRYARVFSGTKGSLVIVGLVVMLLAAIVLIWVNPFSCSGQKQIVLVEKTGDVSSAAKPDADMLVEVTFDDSAAENLVSGGSYPVLFTLGGPDSRSVTDVAVINSASEPVEVYPCGEERYCFIAVQSDVYQAVISNDDGQMSAYFIVPEIDDSALDTPYYVISHNDTAEIKLAPGQSVVPQSSMGTIEKNGMGYEYIPNDDAIGIDTFDVMLADGTTCTVPVLVCNSAPYISPASLKAQIKHTPSRAGMLAGRIDASDADGDNISFKLSSSSGCSVMLSADGSYIAMIDPEYRLGTAEFSFTAGDGVEVSDPYTVEIELSNGLIDASEINKDFVCYSGNDGYYTFELPDKDNDGDRLEWTLVTDNVNGVTVQRGSQITIIDGRMVSYRIAPSLDENFTEVLTFSCSDGWANGSLMTVICNNKANRAPVSSGENSAVIPAGSLALLDVTVKDDCPFDQCAVISVDNVQGGTVEDKTGWSDMKFAFTPDGTTSYCSVTLTVADVLTGASAVIVYDITVE